MWLFGGRHFDAAFHAGFEMARVQAGKVNLDGLGELPNDFTGLPWFHSQLVVLCMLHLRVFFHHLVMVLQVFGCTENKLMAQLPRILNYKANGLALLDPDVIGCEAHGVCHVNLDSAGHLGCNSGLSDGVTVMATGMGSGGK